MSVTFSAVEMVQPDTLKPHPKNPRKGNLEAIAANIARYGFYGALVVQRGTNYVLIGNHRLRAAQGLGLALVPVSWADVDEATAVKILLADNRSSDMAGYDNSALLDTLRNIGDLQGTLFDQDALEDLIAKIGEVPTVEGHEFKGDYADAGKEMEERKAAAERIAEAMKDLVLLMKPATYAQFMEHIKVLQKRWDLGGVQAVVVAAVAQAAGGDSDSASARVERMRRWKEKLDYAVGPQDRKQWESDFGIAPTTVPDLTEEEQEAAFTGNPLPEPNATTP